MSYLCGAGATSIAPPFHPFLYRIGGYPLMDDVELGRILGEHSARLDHLEAGHEEHEETLDEHEEATEVLETQVEGAQQAASTAVDVAYREGAEATQEAVQAAVVVATEVAEEVATEVAEEVATEVAEETPPEGEVTDIVEGEPATP